MDHLTKREQQVLMELLKDARVSDQELARRLKTSRPTIAKIRRGLKEKGFVLRYTPYTNFEKLGLKVNAIILYKWQDYSKQKELKENIRFVKNLPEVITFISGEGIGNKTDVILSVHEDLRAFEQFLQRLKQKWGSNVEDVEVFLSSLTGTHKSYDLTGPVMDQLKKKSWK